MSASSRASGLPRTFKNLGRNGASKPFSAREVVEDVVIELKVGLGDVGDLGKPGDRGVSDGGVRNRGDLGDFVPPVDIDRLLP